MIVDLKDFPTDTTVWEDIFNHLKARGFAVFPPAIKVGECTSAYVVVAKNGLAQHSGNITTDNDTYTVMCYVPKMNYSTLDRYVQDVKIAMSELRPLIKPSGIETPSYYDDSVKAHMISIDYINYKRRL